MSMMFRPKWPFLHMYGSHGMRHVDFRRLTGSQRIPRFWGVTLRITMNNYFISYNSLLIIKILKLKKELNIINCSMTLKLRYQRSEDE